MYLINNAAALRSISLCTTTRTVHTAFSEHDTQQRAQFSGEATDTASTWDACLPPWLLVVRLPHIQGSSGVIISGSPQVTLSLAEGALSHSQGMARKRSGGEAEARSRRARDSYRTLRTQTAEQTGVYFKGL